MRHQLSTVCPTGRRSSSHPSNRHCHRVPSPLATKAEGLPTWREACFWYVSGERLTSSLPTTYGGYGNPALVEIQDRGTGAPGARAGATTPIYYLASAFSVLGTSVAMYRTAIMTRAILYPIL